MKHLEVTLFPGQIIKKLERLGSALVKRLNQSENKSDAQQLAIQLTQLRSGT